VFQSIIESTTIPVLEQTVQFAQARHMVLAGNIANLDTPGYRVRDLSVEEFQGQLKEAIAARRQPATFRSPGETGSIGASGSVGSDRPLAKVAENCRTILRHDDNNTGVEFQVTEMVKNQMQHNLALAIMSNQFQLLQTAISERV
jgi:flagellar basal-body rod protein FlgB